MGDRKGRSTLAVLTRDRSMQDYLAPHRAETVADQLELRDRAHHTDCNQRLSDDELASLRQALTSSFNRRSAESADARLERLRRAGQGLSTDGG